MNLIKTNTTQNVSFILFISVLGQCEHKPIITQNYILLYKKHKLTSGICSGQLCRFPALWTLGSGALWRYWWIPQKQSVFWTTLIVVITSVIPGSCSLFHLECGTEISPKQNSHSLTNINSSSLTGIASHLNRNNKQNSVFHTGHQKVTLSAHSHREGWYHMYNLGEFFVQVMSLSYVFAGRATMPGEEASSRPPDKHSAANLIYKSIYRISWKKIYIGNYTLATYKYLQSTT